MAEMCKKMGKMTISPASKKANARNMRKRLSVQSARGISPIFLDGTSNNGTPVKSDAQVEEEEEDSANHTIPSNLFHTYATKTKTGLVPFNPNKVNQDRALIISSIPHSNNTASLFGVFDGHGMHGHHVSSFCCLKMPEWFQKHASWTKDINQSLIDCFADMTRLLQASSINCTFSGTTAVLCCVTKENIYTANVGDSRALLAREEKGKLVAVELSIDQNPDNPLEKARIEQKNGRVQPCKGPMGEMIGPFRVWLKHQDMPGLAMSRSFGDDVAASVGVISVPEIIVKPRMKSDEFMVVASDGVWEFLSNEEVIGIVSKYDDPKKACRALVRESVRLWTSEEDVIDDITCVVVYF